MDPISNPYTPGPGVPPFELPGRAGPRQAVHIGIERARRGLSFASVLVVGLRGVGKTVLLTHMRREAENAGALSVHVEGSSRRFVLPQLASDLRLLLVQLQESRGKGSAPTANSPLDYQTASNVQRPIEPHPPREIEVGFADALGQDLLVLLDAVGAAARRSRTPLVLFFDDLHCLSPTARSALISALGRCAHQRLPILLVGAGLPHLRDISTEGLQGRLVEYFELGPLSKAAATHALLGPAANQDVHFEEAAVGYVLAATQCHPYFLQELAKHAWNGAPRSPITLTDAHNAAPVALAALDEKFFRTHLNRVTPAERKYLRAMGELGRGPHRSGEIASMLHRAVTAVAPIRKQLVDKGLIWSPAHGDTAFCIPRFDEFLRRAWPGGAWRSQ